MYSLSTSFWIVPDSLRISRPAADNLCQWQCRYQQTIGRGSTSKAWFLLDGSFDNIYYNSQKQTGALYVCGSSTTTAIRPTLWQVPITNDVMGTPVVGPLLVTAASACSPIAEFFNSPTDRIFFSVTASAATASPVSCPTNSTTIGCVMSYNVTSETGFGTGTTTSATAAEAGGTSGIIIDNSLSGTGDSQIYFLTLGSQGCTGNNESGSQGQATGECAIQASQSALQ
jgi:hypothetical protein